ncbi:7-carboxy-7-deazaguanine synthase QueE [Bradyrhizobium neotropicale]|uniref:7-carboxy-7-deazaguanine synthase QueE n=1 Tax=Bradyrhizobium neotropicale TaxID=1497615 RepID=UPI001AD6C464|nr:7-carboxy-7-deazaguanine synthase QueE [Bradyrhizobium neotropicale]MBO4221969.1 7-carboxy-7-deazaguanine synthase QueE [Bradyrhizobium neotropicale]
MQLPLNELFETIQGEGSKTGMPSTFVRLQGCEVGCPWCDTKHTWHMTEAAPLLEVLDKTGSDARFAWVSVGQLVHLVSERRSRHVVLTGGEPCQYDLETLTAQLLDAGLSVQIETSGTEPVRAEADVFVTLSPKLNMPGGRTIVEATLERADEVKMPIGKLDDVTRLERLLSRRKSLLTQQQIWLQPLSESQKATELCRQAAAERGWRVSLQMHKQANIL